MALSNRLLCKMERLQTRVKQLGMRGQHGCNELIEEFLTEHVDMVINRTTNWQSYTDPRTGKKMWYEEEDADWDWLGGHDDLSTDTKSLFKPMSIP